MFCYRFIFKDNVAKQVESYIEQYLEQVSRVQSMFTTVLKFLKCFQFLKTQTQ